ncbi:MAG: hypothetical protein DELT_02541 [Desulfovibrio sp.]
MTKKYQITPERLGLYRKIEIGRKQLPEMSDDDYFRDWLEKHFSKRSRTELSGSELSRVVDLFTGLGAVFTSKKAAPKKRTNNKQTPQARPDWIEVPENVPFHKEKREICAIWRKLGYSMTSLETRIKRQFGQPTIMWVHDKQKLSILLSDLQKRERAFDKKRAASEGES